MAQTALSDAVASPEIRCRGAVLWLNLQRPQQALPILKILSLISQPKYNWSVSYVKTNVELGRIAEAEKALDRLLDRYPEKSAAWQLAVWAALQQSDYARAAAAMEVAVRLNSANGELTKKLSHFYLMAGVPVKAARAFQKTVGSQPAPSDWDRLADIYLSGQRYELALSPAKTALAAEETADRWIAVGDIAYHLHRFEESCAAYQRAAALSDAGDIRLKAGYALMKIEKLALAADFFREAMDRSANNSTMADEAFRNLAYIKKMRPMQLK